MRSPAPGAETVGWELHDEIDMEMSPAEGHATLQRMLAALPADRRLRYNNFGKGVMFWESDAEARRYVNAVDLRSNDIYWFTDPLCAGARVGPSCDAAARACRRRNAAELRTPAPWFAVCAACEPRGSSPVWNFVELGHPFTEADAPTITSPQVAQRSGRA